MTPFKVADLDSPHHYAAKIQKAVRRFIERKHNTLPVPDNFKCIFTQRLFVTPVVASDG